MTGDVLGTKVFPHDSHLNRPVTVGELPLTPACAPSIWPANESSTNSSQIPISGFASELPVGRSTLTKAQRLFKTKQIRSIRAPSATQVASPSADGITHYSQNSQIHRSTANLPKENVLASASFQSDICHPKDLHECHIQLPSPWAAHCKLRPARSII